MFAKSMAKTIAPHLEPGESLRCAVMAQGRGMNAAAMAHLGTTLHAVRAEERAHAMQQGAGAAAGSAGVEVERRMVLAVTDRRFLVFKAGGAFTVKAQELIGAVPLADVDGIDIAEHKLTKVVTLRIRGAAIEVETARAQPAEQLPAALAALRPTAIPG